MSRALYNLSSLRTALPPLAQAGPSSRPFHTSSPDLKSAPSSPAPWKKPKPFKRSVTQRKRAFHEEKSRAKKRLAQTTWPDYVLGHVFTSPIGGKKGYHGRDPPPPDNLWENSRLAKCLIHPRQVWSWPIPKYEVGHRPRHFLPGLSPLDQDTLFGALPHVSTAISYDPDEHPSVRDEKARKVMDEQGKQEEMMYRILDLRNASRSQINAFNRRRIVDEFGVGWNHGDYICQSALLTMEIRNLNEHIIVNYHDVRNRERLRKLVYDRAKRLKYVKREYPKEYDQALLDLGLAPETVEGELVFRV